MNDEPIPVEKKNNTTHPPGGRAQIRADDTTKTEHDAATLVRAGHANQMWQSDIFTFRLGGGYAYVVAFLDDYSRSIVGADLFRSPTAEAVIEMYRQSIAEFKPPKEMLTDNGRQYTSWRGTSRFEAELKKDGVAHFKSRPQHPMTLGKIERFWETLWQQFLTRAQFGSFEDARERIRFWIKHYNHKRPNHGIGGLCPADRFFEIQTAAPDDRSRHQGKPAGDGAGERGPPPAAALKDRHIRASRVLIASSQQREPAGRAFVRPAQAVAIRLHHQTPIPIATRRSSVAWCASSAGSTWRKTRRCLHPLAQATLWLRAESSKLPALDEGRRIAGRGSRVFS